VPNTREINLIKIKMGEKNCGTKVRKKAQLYNKTNIFIYLEKKPC